MRITLLIILTAVVACKQPQNAETRSKNTETAAKVFEHFNAHRWEEMAALYADSAEFLDPSYGMSLVKVNKSDLVKKYQELEGIFPNIRDSIVAIIPSADEKSVTVQFISLGTAPDGSKLELPICTVLFFENGSIVKDFTYYDN